jgi:hypothetical protein
MTNDDVFRGMVGWCYNEEAYYTLEDLGDGAWQTGCPLCGDSNCRKGYTDPVPPQREQTAPKNWRDWGRDDIVSAVRGASRVAGLTLGDEEVDRLVRELLNGPFNYLADAKKGENENEVK